MRRRLEILAFLDWWLVISPSWMMVLKPNRGSSQKDNESGICLLKLTSPTFFVEISFESWTVLDLIQGNMFCFCWHFWRKNIFGGKIFLDETFSEESFGGNIFRGIFCLWFFGGEILIPFKGIQSHNPPCSAFENNTIPDGGVAPRHLLRLDWVTRKDLKGQKKCKGFLKGGWSGVCSATFAP